MNRLEECRDEAKKVLTGLEDGTLTIGQSALKCLKVARLMGDEQALLWLRYETGGYPRNMPPETFKLAWDKGRGYYSDTKKRVFIQTADEIESLIIACQEALKGYSTSGVSISGERAAAAMDNLTRTVGHSTRNLLKNIMVIQKRLARLRGNYYDYALAVYNGLNYSGRVEDIFHEYREQVDASLAAAIPETLRRLQTAYECLDSEDHESWAQVVFTCRRLMRGLADKLYKHPVDQPYITKSGRELDVTGSNYKNKLFAVIDEFGDSSARVRLTVSNIIYIINYVEDLYQLINRGDQVGSAINYQEARMAVIHTYVLLGDILLCCNFQVMVMNVRKN